MSVKVAIWGSNISGGFLRSTADQTKDGSFAYNLRLAQLADRLGVDAILFPTRYLGGLGGSDAAGGQLDSLTIVGALAVHTRQVHFISAVLPAFVPPVTLAKMGATLEQITSGRWHVNLVSGWFQEEQEMFGIPWISHSERYRRSEEYLQVVKGLWQKEEFSFEGEHYQIRGGKMRPTPVQKPYPAIFQGGNSEEAQEMAGKFSDWYFMNGASIEELRPQMERVSEIASRHHRRVRFAVNAFVIARETEKEAQEEFRYIVDHADVTAINKFKNYARGAAGMWSRAASISDFVANNEGFRTGLIGSYQQVRDKIRELQLAGVEMILTAFRYPVDELPLFFEHVLQKKLGAESCNAQEKRA
ncbi:LLM class flavin-dependent oxidoreductase [Brevibacillus sp. B_LB10_24]|uniref:LLM class flavin-dependent oxidoreductase n=1 Tax=Brevibacillus sp. B_LB10_24 TaxID=3380645 RepID=UPI0038BD1BBF